MTFLWIRILFYLVVFVVLLVSGFRVLKRWILKRFEHREKSLMQPPAQSVEQSTGDEKKEPKPAPAPVKVVDEEPYVPEEGEYVLGPMTPALAAMLPETEKRKEETLKELKAAGHYEKNAWENLAAVRYLGLMLPLLLCGTLLVIAPERFEPVLLSLLIMLPMLGWSIPRLYVRSQGKERALQIEQAMPDMLDMLNMCVSQGLTVPESLTRISQELGPVYPALAQELRIVVEQARLGSLQQALQNFSARVDVPEVHSFTTLLIQTERMGTSVSTALTEYSDTMREGLRQRADEKANSASFKLLFPTVLCLMPAVYMFLLGPAIVELNDFFDRGGIESLNNGQTVTESLQNPIAARRNGQ